MNKILKKTIISGIVLGTIGCGNIKLDSACADYTGRGDIATSKYEVYVFDRDDFSSEKIGILDANRDVYRILSGDSCDLVNSDNLLFFVDKNDLEIKNDSTSSINYYKVNFNGATTTQVNLRVGPGTDNDIITTVDGETLIEIIGISSNGWYLVDYNNVLGFMSSDYVKKINLDEINNKINLLPSVERIVEATTELNVRSGASTDYDKITTVSKGYRMSMNRRLDNGWYEIEKDGQIGYVCGDFVKEEYAIDGECLQLVALDKDSTIYDSPYGNVVTNSPKYEVCRVYGEVDDFYYVECDGSVGFVFKKNCDKLEGTYIIVDISDQLMTVYKGTEVVLRSDVVTGKDTTPTKIGLFSVLEKDSPRELVGDDYDVWVDFWLKFYKGQGLHDLKRKEYGGEIYHNNGSHGCINLPWKVAKKLYGIANEGDQVLVKR